MSIQIQRENLEKFEMLIKKGHTIKTIFNQNIFFKENNLNGIIRIQSKDFSQINQKSKYLTHFNIEQSNHNVGEIYILPKIIKSGYYKSDNDYLLPILDFKNSLICKCIEVKEKLNYVDLKKQDFKHSMIHIKNQNQLKKEIISRYSKSMPNLSKEKILSMGISLTKLEILEIFDGNFKNESYIDYLDLNLKGSTRKGFGKGIVDSKKTNKNLVALTADLKPSVQLTEFADKYPKDFYEFSISEQNMMSAAAGMCLNNKIPFVTSFAVFNPGRNWDQLRVSVCYSNHNVKVLGSHAGLTTGPDGATHQALEDIAITRVLPNLTVIVPSDQEEARKATIAAIKHKGPVYLRVSRENSLNITSKESSFEIGKANILDIGVDVTIIACGITLQFALEARKKLKLEHNISATVINLHTIKPIDKQAILKYANLTNAIVTIEEHQKSGGVGSAVAEVLAENYPVPIEIIGVEDSFGESGEGYELLEKYKISTKEIIKRVKKVINRKNQK